MVTASLGVLLLASTVGGSGGTTIVGFVLAEAIALYVGYGALVRFASPILDVMREGD